MRTRAWRRYTEDRIVLKRLGRYGSGHWSHYPFRDVNNIPHAHPTISDYIGTHNNFIYKTHTTTKWSTSDKIKYSPNRNKGYWRGGSNNTREYNKRELLQILKENGIK